MANDPNRDLLPVKEDCCKNGKGYSGKFDYQLLGKLSRCELEDRFLRLQDEQTHIKKLANCQEEKIKRLGTKLLRLINEKKSGRKLSENKETEDLHLRIIELEHENYALKDKNTVLKQQLSSHSRHLTTHRSPNRSNHTSPLITMRQSALQTQCDNYEDNSKTAAAEMQLQEAEAHIRELNDEIKCLHNKIDFLQQNVEKNSLDSRKIKVTENIELIRLQRSLKQQAIQIAALQAQIKNSENNQKILKEELTKAHNENDEALHLISIKQNEILNLCSKLEEENLNRLQEDELKLRVHDLMRERDCLKEKSDFLMKTIAAKTEENEKIIELQKLLAEEKSQKGKLEETLELLRKNNTKGPCKESPKSLTSCNTVTRAQQTVDTATDRETSNSVGEISEGTDESCHKCHLYLSFCKCSQESFLKSEIDSDTEPNDCVQEKRDVQKFCKESSLPVDKYFAEKMKMERELQYLREMLRSQTCRCEAQQAEINRLMYEIKLNEEKCNETLHRLDWHLKIFQTFEMSEFEALMKLKQNERLAKATGEPVTVRSEPAQKKPEIKESPRPVKPIESEKALLTREYSRSGSYVSRELAPPKRRVSKLEEVTVPPPKLVEKSDIIVPEKETTVQHVESKRNNRFVDQKFLDSSDEEPENADTFSRPYMRALKKNDSDDSVPLDFKNQDSDHIENPLQWYRQPEKTQKSAPDKNSFTWAAKGPSDVSFSKPEEKDLKRLSKGKFVKQDLDEFFDSSDKVNISILWFEIQSKSSLSKNNRVEMIFIDFMFLNLNGVETETPQSLPKPKNSKEKCSFNFTRSINISDTQKKLLASSLKEPDSPLITFKVVSDSDDSNGVSEDIGIAIVTAKEFVNMSNKNAFNVQVKNVENTKEVVGTLAIKIEASPGLLNVS